MSVFTNYDREAKPVGNFEPIPAGWYTACIVEAESQQSKAGHEMAVLRYKIVEGEHAERVLFVRLNLNHPNEQPRNIAQSQYAAIRKAMNIQDVTTPHDLLNKPHRIKVALNKRKDTGEDTNEIKGWEAVNAAPPAQPSEGAQAPNWMAQKG